MITCNVCGKETERTGAHQTMCPDCRKIRRAEKMYEYNKRYRAKYPERVKAQRRSWYEKNIIIKN